MMQYCYCSSSFLVGRHVRSSSLSSLLTTAIASREETTDTMMIRRRRQQRQLSSSSSQQQAERMKAIENQKRMALKQHDRDYYLAQFNLAKLKAPLHDPKITEFALALDPINQLAKASPGFIWLHENDSDEEKDSIKELRDDPLIMPNLSLWEDLDALHHFVFKTGHFMYYKRRKEWVTSMEHVGYPHAVYWWHPSQQDPPTLQEAFDRIHYLRDHGNTSDAFDFKTAKEYPSPSKAETVGVIDEETSVPASS